MSTAPERFREMARERSFHLTKISAFPDQPHHFLDWLRENDYPATTEETFAPRAVFGRYIQSLLATTSGINQ
jgi:hydroxyacylglutathione hydrolase